LQHIVYRGNKSHEGYNNIENHTACITIKNLKACETILDLETVFEEYYGEIAGRMAAGEV